MMIQQDEYEIGRNEVIRRGVTIIFEAFIHERNSGEK